MTSEMTCNVDYAAQQVKYMNNFAVCLRAQNKMATDAVTDVIETHSSDKKDVPMLFMKLETLKTDLELIAEKAGEIIDETASATAFIEEILADSEDCDKGNTFTGTPICECGKGNTFTGIPIYEEGDTVPFD